MPIDEGTIHFINVNKSDGRILQEAYEKAKAKELDVALVTGKELLEKGVDEDQTLFVTDEFSGDVFDMLIAHKKRIFGPICVLQCIHNGGPLPDKPHPVHSFAMSKAIVTSTNMARPLKLKLEQRIEWMSGVFCKSFISEVTHLVAGDVGGAKYTAAARLDKPIVLPSWIEDAWQQAEYQLDATDTAFVGKHRCPTLKGCSICVSGLSGRQKEEIKRLVEENGGVYLPDLKMKDTTHLLIEKPTGQKYDFALRWSVHCVQPDWLYDSINARCWKKESPYLVKRDKGPHFNSNATLSITTVDATMNSTGLSIDVSRKAAQAAKQSAESYGSKDISNNSRQSSLQTSGLKSLRKSKDRSSKGGTCDYDVAIPSGEQFLDGCRLYLTGFNESQLEYLQKIINAGGGTRFNHINHSVSHIVVGDKPLQDVEKLLKSEFSPHVVTVQWLLESCRQVQCLPEQGMYVNFPVLG
jgi:topoisomerase (DNA) II binding protein 1